jgi:hypothetical protein
LRLSLLDDARLLVPLRRLALTGRTMFHSSWIRG